MILLIGTNNQISESLAEFLPDKQDVRFVQLNSAEVQIADEVLFSAAKLIIVNLYGVYEQGVNIIRKLRQLFLKTPILALDNHESPTLGMHLIDNGADAYISIFAPGEVLSTTINYCLNK